MYHLLKIIRGKYLRYPRMSIEAWDLCKDLGSDLILIYSFLMVIFYSAVISISQYLEDAILTNKTKFKFSVVDVENEDDC